MRRRTPQSSPARRVPTRVRVLATVGLLFGLLVGTPTPAAADPALGGSATAYGAMVAPVVPETPKAESTLAADDDTRTVDATETLIEVPAEPLALSGTLTASASVHEPGDIGSQLLVNSQPADGPYNASAFGEIEGAKILVDAVDAEAQISLVQADAVRAEAVAICNGTSVTYAAQSEIVNLDIGGQDIPLNAPLEQIVDAITDILDQTTLDQVVEVQRNVVTEMENGIAVSALQIEVLRAAVGEGEPAPVDIVLGHAEVRDVSCGQIDLPECSDDVDNADPEDTLADEDDPGCHTDGDPDNPDSYDPNDDDESNALARKDPEPILARTGGDVPLAGAVVVGLAGLAVLQLLRRRQTV